jgi:hypothetical protein
LRSRSIGGGDRDRMKAVLRMTKGEFPPKPDSISSGKMDNSGRNDAIIALGRKLVIELGLEPSVDTLGRWMAHYVAELIAKAESATRRDRRLAEKACFETILALWKHRAELPRGKRPFESMEPIVRAVESLDPDDHTPRYFRVARQAQREREEKSEVDRWLVFASGLDDTAKILIGICLAEAANAAVDKAEEWVRLAKAAGAEAGPHEIVIRYVSSNVDLGKMSDPNDEIRRQLQDRLGRLEVFIELAKAVADDWTSQLKALPPPLQGVDNIAADEPPEAT